MKKYLVLGLLALMPFTAKASLMGFLDGNEYNAEGIWQCLFLMDGNCYDRAKNVLMSRAVTTVEAPLTADTNVSFPIINPATNEPLQAAPTFSGGYLTLQGQCGVDDAGFVKQENDLKDELATTLANVREHSTQPGIDIPVYQRDYERKVAAVEAERIARQEECAKQLSDLNQ